jgi:hypothetical protein
MQNCVVVALASPANIPQSTALYEVVVMKTPVAQGARPDEFSLFLWFDDRELLAVKHVVATLTKHTSVIPYLLVVAGAALSLCSIRLGLVLIG